MRRIRPQILAWNHAPKTRDGLAHVLAHREAEYARLPAHQAAALDGQRTNTPLVGARRDVPHIAPEPGRPVRMIGKPSLRTNTEYPLGNDLCQVAYHVLGTPSTD